MHSVDSTKFVGLWEANEWQSGVGEPWEFWQMLCFHVEMGSFFVAVDVVVVVVVAVVVLLLLGCYCYCYCCWYCVCDCCFCCCCFVSVSVYHLAQRLSFSLSILYYKVRLMRRSTMDFLSSSPFLALMRTLSIHNMCAYKYVSFVRISRSCSINLLNERKWKKVDWKSDTVM